MMAHHAVKKLKKTQTDTHSEEVRWMVKLNGGEGTGSQCNREGKEELCRGGARKQRRTYVAWMVCGKVECIWFLTKRCFWNFTYYARCRRTLNSVGRISCKKVMAIGIRLLLHPPPFASSPPSYNPSPHLQIYLHPRQILTSSSTSIILPYHLLLLHVGVFMFHVPFCIFSAHWFVVLFCSFGELRIFL